MYNVPVVPNGDSAFTFLLHWEEWLYCQWNLWQGWKGGWFGGGGDDVRRPAEIHRTQNCTSLHIKITLAVFYKEVLIDWILCA